MTLRAPSPIGASQFFAYAALGAAIKGMTLPLIAYLPPLYSSLPGMTLATVGLVFMLARLWDIVTDPLLGMWIDRSRPPLGRRKFWILVATPALMAALWPLFHPPEQAGALWLLGMLFVFYIGWTLLTIDHAAWPADLTDDPGERKRLIGWREWAGVLGMLAVLSAPMFVVGKEAPLAQQVAVMAQVLIILLPLTTLLALWLLPRHVEPIDTRVKSPSLRFGDIWQLVRNSTPVRRLLLADLASGGAYAANSATAFFIMTYYLGVGGQFSTIMLCFMLGLAVGLPAFIRLSVRLGSRTSFIAAMAGSAVASLCFALLPSGQAWAPMAVNALLGFFTGGYQLNLNAEMVRLAAHDREATGQERSSLHLALLAMTNKVGYALAIGAVYLLLELTGVDRNSAAGMPDWALIGFGMVLPAALFGLAAWAFTRIFLDDAQRELPTASA